MNKSKNDKSASEIVIGVQGTMQKCSPRKPFQKCMKVRDSHIIVQMTGCLQNSLQAQGSEAPLRGEFTMCHGKDTYFKQIETTQL